MILKQRILFGVILFAFLVVCYTTIASNYQAPKQTNNNFPCWIAKEKIRAGYLYAYNNPKRINLVKDLELNTLIVKGWKFHRREDFAETIENYRSWARATKKANLHMFIAYNWQPEPESYNNSYRKVVYSDGKTGALPCPRDKQYWQNYMTRLGTTIAKLSLEKELQIDGLFLDTEDYGSRNRGFKNYSRKACFCDSCFSEFLLANGYRGENLPIADYAERKNWLDRNKLLDSYFAFQENEVESLAFNFEENLHKINPSFLIGLYPSPLYPTADNWVRNSIARGLSTNGPPVLIFGTESYSGGNWQQRTPDNPVKLYKELGVNCRYIAGFLLRSYSSTNLGVSLYTAGGKYTGYWIYKIPMLWGYFEKNEKLMHGTVGEYRDSITRANKKIGRLIGQTNASKGRLK